MDVTCFIPACGEGTRTASLGPHKPFIPVAGVPLLHRVINMMPPMPLHIAVRADMGMIPLNRPATVHMMLPTAGQADTIYRWLDTMAMRFNRMRDPWVLISNCDNAIGDADITLMLRLLESHSQGAVPDPSTSAYIATFTPLKSDNASRFSYCHIASGNRVARVTEKTEPTGYAVAGVYLVSFGAMMANRHQNDIHFSQLLSRLRGGRVVPVKRYFDWNDADAIIQYEKSVGWQGMTASEARKREIEQRIAADIGPRLDFAVRD